MAATIKVDDNGVAVDPLAERELAYSSHTEELYVGSGSGSAGDITTSGETRITRNKELFEMKTTTLLATGDGVTVEYLIDNNTDEPLTVLLEGFVVDSTEYTRTATGIEFHEAPATNEQVYIIAHNGYVS